MSLENLNFALSKDVLPFMIDLSSIHFLTLLQNSEQIWFFYTDFISGGSNEAIVPLNTFLKENFKKSYFYC